MNIERYVLEDAEGNSDEYTADTIAEARDAARARREPVAIIARIYEYTDSELVEAWSNGAPLEASIWPPADQPAHHERAARYTR